MRWTWIAPVALAAMLAVGGMAYRRAHVNGRMAAAYEPVAFAREHIEMAIESTGVVEPRNRLEIKPPFGGRVDEVLVEEGQSVAKGDIIARMSSTERATLLDAARTKGDAVLRKWENAYKTTPLIAPLDGTIIARNTEPGQTIAASDTVLVLSDRLIVSAQVDETDVGQVQVGQAARITLDAYRNVRVQGTVTRIAFDAVTVNNVTVYEVEVEPENIPPQMKSGMTATVEFIVANVDDALTLPADAVVSEEGKSYVLVDGGQPGMPPERWRVLTGLSSGGNVEILAGLEGTEPVVKKSFAMVEAKKTGTSPFMPRPSSRRR